MQDNSQMETKKKITVETTVNTSIEKAWKYWTTPDHIINWNNASDDWYTPKAQNDLRPGGKFSSTMAARDGSESFDFGGIYDKVVEHQLIEYTLGDDRKVSVSFRGDDKSSHISETFETEDTHSAEMQKAGWQAILDNFKKYTENN